MHAYKCVRACFDDGAAMGVEEVRAAAGSGAGEDEGVVECISFSCAAACARTAALEVDATCARTAATLAIDCAPTLHSKWYMVYQL